MRKAGKMVDLPDGTLTESYSPTVVGGKYVLGTATNNWPGSDLAQPLGVTTTDGWTFEDNQTVETADRVAGYFNSPYSEVTGIASSVSGTLVAINQHIDAVLHNLPDTAWTGTIDATHGAIFKPAATGKDVVRRQFLWISEDNTRFVLILKALQTAAVTKQWQDGVDYQKIAVTFTCELPDSDVSPSGVYYIAGTCDPAMITENEYAEL